MEKRKPVVTNQGEAIGQLTPKGMVEVRRVVTKNTVVQEFLPTRRIRRKGGKHALTKSR